MRRRGVFVLTYWSWPDALIQTYTLPYVRQIRAALPADEPLWLLTLEQKPPSTAEASAIRTKLKSEGIHWLWIPYTRFGMGMVLRLAWVLVGLWLRVLTMRFRALHAWCMPAGALGWLLSVSTSTPLHMDSYEPHAEAMVENGTWLRTGWAYRILAWFERRLTRRASVLISCTEGYLQAAPQLFNTSFALKQTFVKPACTDLQLFRPELRKDPQLMAELGLEGALVAVYAGKFGGIYLRQEVFAFLAACYKHWGAQFRALLLTNHPESELQNWAKAEDLPWACVILRFVPHAEVPRYMGLGDFGLTPVLSAPSKRYCTPIKDGEYWALGLPVVITPNISDDTRLIETHRAGVVQHYTCPETYPETVRQLDALLQEPEATRTPRIRDLAETYRPFTLSEQIYRQLYGG